MRRYGSRFHGGADEEGATPLVPSTSPLGVQPGDIQYINLNLVGGQPGGLSRNVQRAGPIVTRANDYYVAIARMSIPPSPNIWMWQPPLLLGQNEWPPTRTIFSVRMTATDLYAQITVASEASMRVLNASWGVDTRGASPPEIPVTQQPLNGYGAVYNYQQIALMINDAMAAATTGLNLKINENTTLRPLYPNGVVPPFLTWDGVTQLFTFNAAPYDYYSNTIVDTNYIPARIKVQFSENFLPFLAGWNVARVQDAAGAGWFELAVTDLAGNNWLVSHTGTDPGDVTWTGPPGRLGNPMFPPDRTAAMVVMPQAYSAPFVFQTALSTIRVTSNLPITLEGTDATGLALMGTPQAASAGIMQDFTPALLQANEFSQPFIYTADSIIPGARFVELVGGGPISDVSLTIVWVDNLGNEHPILLGADRAATVKLVFVKRALVRASAGLTL